MLAHVSSSDTGVTPDASTAALVAVTRRCHAAHSWLFRDSPQGVATRLERAFGMDVPVATAEPLDPNSVVVADIRARAERMSCVGGLLVVDNTVPTRFGCVPCELGAQVSVEPFEPRPHGEGIDVGSVCRWRLGEGVAGSQPQLLVVSASRDALRWIPRLAEVLDALAVHSEESLAAGVEEGLDAMMQSRFDQAQVVAEYLRCHPAVERVTYPGLPGDPSHDLAATVLRHGFGPVVAFATKVRPTLRQVCSCGGGDPFAAVWQLEEMLGSSGREAPIGER